MDFSKVRDALTARGWHVSVFRTKEEASDYLNAQIDGVSVGFGGSVTLREMGLYDSLSKHNTVFNHWRVPDGSTADAVRAAAADAEVYITSVNGAAETGEMINIDGTGNRAASTLFGHRRAYFVVGRNKLTPTYGEALWRARNIAAPKNAKRLGRRTPCAVNGERCFDCKSPERICKALVVYWGPTTNCEAEVVLVDEDLGY